MENSLKLFLIGLTLGITVSIILFQSDVEDDDSFIKKFFGWSAKLVQLVFMIIMVTTIPFLAIEPLKKRFTRKTFLPFSFLGGTGTGFLFIGIISIILSIVI